MFATHWCGNMSAARHQGYQWLKINVDARRTITIVFFEPQIFTDLTDVCYASVRQGVRSNIIFNHLISLFRSSRVAY